MGLHMGPSGLVAFDLDCGSLAEIPDELAAALRKGLWQRSRREGTDSPDRGHYVFVDDFGAGLSAGEFAAFGDVRGGNGYIMLEPSPHAKTTGEYKWESRGEVPLLPSVLRRCLKKAPVNEQPQLTDAEFDRFVADPDNGRDERLEALWGPLNWFENEVRGGGSAHQSMLSALCWAFREVIVGFYPAAQVHNLFQEAFVDSFGWDGRRKDGRKGPSTGEFNRLVLWAIAQAKIADPAETLARADRDAVADEESFWAARPELQQLRQAARARLMSPWSVFGCALARAVAVIPPTVMLPELIGSRTGLNLFVGLVGVSGDGKGSSHSVVKDFMKVEPPVHQVNLGTGEGIAREYARKYKGEQIDIRNSVLFSVNEIDRLASLLSRSGATLGSVIREAWSGEKLGFANKNDENRFNVEDHRYRMVMTVGIQPERSRVLFESEDGGTPQRFLWLPAWDPNVSDDDEDEPDGVIVLPRWPGKGKVVTQEGAPPDPNDTSLFKIAWLRLGEEVQRREQQVLKVPDAVRKTVRDNKRKQHRREAKTLDGHALLTRLKVAAGLMWMNGRTDEVTDEDWLLAGTVMAVSDRTRDDVRRELAGAQRKQNAARGRARAEQDHAAENHSARLKENDDATVAVTAERIITVLRNNNGPLARNRLAKACGQKHKPYLDRAIKALAETGRVEVEETEYHGKSGHRVRLTGPD
ncbi:bifunctional DNA primase/polymerase [Gordonia sp. NPDC057258]|uniref:bifunctional DNA primase/polymerase n=1 Tax=Gordonia sp. NPDC057258 TaxID=3346072 RepID=UPI00363E0E86